MLQVGDRVECVKFIGEERGFLLGEKGTIIEIFQDRIDSNKYHYSNCLVEDDDGHTFYCKVEMFKKIK
jgi:hypothetical protein